MPPARIALVGNLANVAYRTCKFLRREGVQADVYVDNSELVFPTSNPENEDAWILENPPAWLKITPKPSLPVGMWKRQPLRIALWGSRRIGRKIAKHVLIRTLRKYDLIVSYCCAPWFVQEIGCPYVSVATGSDLRELALEDSPRGRHARSIFEHAQLVIHGPDPASLEAANLLKLRSSYVHFPVDTEFFVPSDTLRPRNPTDELVVFHPSNLDWTYTGPDRWTKGNDRLFRALARLVNEDSKARLVYLERGPDIEATRELVKNLGIESHVEAISRTMPRAELRDYYGMADVVADQFSRTSFGQIGLEAMSCGKPVLVDVDLRTMNLFYEEFPPVLNCRTEDEIYTQLKVVLDFDFRQKLGQHAREWIMNYHGSETATTELVKRLEDVLGRSLF